MDIWGKSEQMSCKQFEKLIPDFIAKKLDYPDLKRFYEHMEQCADCREELDIQFLVMQGIQRLEDGNAFDLQFELRQRLEETRRKIHIHGISVSGCRHGDRGGRHAGWNCCVDFNVKKERRNLIKVVSRDGQS